MHRRVLVSGVVLGLSSLIRVAFAEQPVQHPAASPQWFRGQLHTHSYWSDGQAFPEQAIEAYKQRGYNFMCLSDHNQFAKSTNTWREVKSTKIAQAVFDTYVETYGRDWVESKTDNGTNGPITSVRLKTYLQVKAKVDEPGKFLFLPGVELTQSLNGVDVHLNYINLPLALRSITGAGIVKIVSEPLTISELIASNATEVARAASKQQIPYLLMLNHPFWRYYNIVPQNLIDCPDIRFFEVTNNGSQFAPHPQAPNYTVEQFWDAVNAFRRIQGQPLLYGIGSEDTHVYDAKHVGDAWMMVRATELTTEKLLVAINQGDCYASNGVELKNVDFSVTDNTLRVAVKAEQGVNYRIQFITTKQGFDRTVTHVSSPIEKIGKAIRPARTIPIYSDDIGRIVKTVAGTEASYRLESDDLYVRARVESDVPGKFASHFHPKVKMAWTQPYVAIKKAKEPELPSSILITNVTARLIELTATVSLTNASMIDVQKIFFRLTTPPGDLPYQRSRLLMPFPGDTLKPHKNQLDNYLEMSLSIPAHKTVEREVKFFVLLLPVDYLNVPSFPLLERDKEAAQKYLLPSDLIESDAAEIMKVKDLLFRSSSSDMGKAKAAYEYPARLLKYRPQKAVGAVKALQTGIGDCTEYSCLFCALCRAGGVPARRVAVFNLGAKNEITDKEPNHDTAEVFLTTHGWVPVDPNGGGGKYDRPIGFARAGNTQIVLKRENAWVWSTFLPPVAVENNSIKPTIKSSVRWQAKVVQEGASSELLSQFCKGNYTLLTSATGQVNEDRVHQNGKIRVFYQTEGQDAVELADRNQNGIPDQVENVMTQTVAAQLLFVEVLGFPDPFQKERFRTASFLDIHIRHKNKLKSNGLAFDELQLFKKSWDPKGTVSIAFSVASSVKPESNLTPAHEFFHLIQYSTTYFKNCWFSEGTARWSECGLGIGGLGPVRKLGSWPLPDDQAASLFKCRMMHLSTFGIRWQPNSITKD